MKHAEQVLLHPVVSEKSYTLMEGGAYIFVVDPDATKIDVRRAVELMFEVKVEGVQVVNEIGKERRFGGRRGRTQDSKKAYVRLAQGQSIDYERSAAGQSRKS